MIRSKLRTRAEKEEEMKAFIVGRHPLAGEEGIEPVGQKNVNFPADSRKCVGVIHQLVGEAQRAGAEAIVFQAVPGQLAVALAKVAPSYPTFKFGAIVNVPGDRPSGVVREFVFPGGVDFEEAIRFVNPRAKIEKHVDTEKGGVAFRVTVDPPLRFEFSHIEWF